uniref:Glycosyltransferase family 92 protein n=1 Tax=Mola mola TaxID=94237 RepID=A0A3Q3WUX7_MOLML
EKVDYHCLICCEDQLHISKGVNNILSTHYYFAYGPAHIMCPLPLGCDTPSHITLMSAGANFTEGKVLKVLNVSFSAMLSTQKVTDVLLVQSLEMLQLLGVNRVAVYLTNSSRETQHILDYYTHKGIVEVIPWSIPRLLKVSRSWLPSLSPGDIHYFGQMPALNDCIYRYMYQTRYLALHDVDELILPHWTELLPVLEKQHGADQCYSFENNVFPINVILPPPGSQSLAPESLWFPGSQYVPGVNILAHLYQEPIIESTRSWKRKLILNPRGVISPDVHGLAEAQISCFWVDRNVARMYHTSCIYSISNAHFYFFKSNFGNHSFTGYHPQLLTRFIFFPHIKK